MVDIFLQSLLTWIELSSLALCFGTIVCRLWVLPPAVLATVPYSENLLSGIWRLFGVGIIVLVAGSLAEMFVRAREMSGVPISMIPSILPTVLIRTHYGHVWLIRAAALSALLFGWSAGRRRPASRTIPAFMLGLTAVVAMTKSAAGHASDLGDFSLLELADWLHLMAASIWGGSLLVIWTAILPTVMRSPDADKTVVAGVGRRLSRIVNGMVIGVVVVTASYNAWFFVNSFEALWKTHYGQTVIAKISAFFLLLILAAYSEGHEQMPLDLRVARFIKTARVQAMVALGIFFLAALLSHQVPGRHHSHMEHAQSVMKPEMTHEGHEEAVHHDHQH